ncbi:YodC family protein [Aeromonas veronii]|uniref:YodC family protein n=1 Tax=Aeromonas allosaccharophila TaxID=656 RepID=UPI0038E2F2BB
MARAPKFSVGDVVKLASGGPDMTIHVQVKSIGEHREFNGLYKTQWFAGKKLETGTFAEETLEKVEKQ